MSAPRAGNDGTASAALATAFVLSALVIALPYPAEVEGAFSRLFAGALPWLALAGLPRSGGSGTGGSGTAVGGGITWTAGACATLIAAAALDHHDGLALVELGIAIPLLACAVFLLAFAAERARAGVLHGALWALLVPLPALLAGAAELFDAGAWTIVAAASPLALAWRHALRLEDAPGLFAVVLPVLAIGVLAVLPARTEAEAPA